MTDVERLIDEAYLIAEDFCHTRSKESLIQIIQVIVKLNKLGYDFIWDRRRHIVGATVRQSLITSPNAHAVQVTPKGIIKAEDTQIN